MKNFKLLICVVLAALAFASCSDTETYADMKKKERSAINRYITNKKINVISESQFEQQGCTTDTAKNEFVLFENTGVYMQIRSKGTGKKLKDGEDVDVTCRFNEYNLLEGDSALQLTNIYQYAWCTDKMNVKNTSGTLVHSLSSSALCTLHTARLLCLRAGLYHSHTSISADTIALMPSWLRLSLLYHILRDRVRLHRAYTLACTK